MPNVSWHEDESGDSLCSRALDTHYDVDHGRMVITVGGTHPQVLDWCRTLAEHAFDRWDLEHHNGAHPRFGVVDVLPLVPYGIDESTARVAAAELSRSIEALGVPVYTYDRADSKGRTLPELRRFLRTTAHAAHPTAGVVCLGIRDPLVAFNVNLRCPIGAAREIARAIRTQEIRALGFELPSRGLVQVSMNLIQPERVGPRAAFDRVVSLARDRQLELVNCEVVGLVPHPILPELEGLPLRRPVRSIEQALEERELRQR